MRSFCVLGCTIAFALLHGALALAAPATTEWRWAVGAQVDPASHGIVDLGIRYRGFSAQVLTDTLDLRFRHRVPQGEWQFGARLALFGAELLFSPWENNAPAPEEALRAGYLGADISRAWWFSDGRYIGLSSELRHYTFGAWRESTRDIPDATLRARTGVKLGIWRRDLQTEILVGHLIEEARHGGWIEARLESPPGPGWGLANRTHLGWSTGLTRLSRFRLGGLNPYVVPFGGLGWAQYWVERYVVQRLGVAFSANTIPLDLQLGTDIGFWDRVELQLSMVAAARFKLGVYECAMMGGMTALRDGQADFGNWSLFFWFERPWG